MKSFKISLALALMLVIHNTNTYATEHPIPEAETSAETLPVSQQLLPQNGLVTISPESEGRVSEKLRAFAEGFSAKSGIPVHIDLLPIQANHGVTQRTFEEQYKNDKILREQCETFEEYIHKIETESEIITSYTVTDGYDALRKTFIERGTSAHIFVARDGKVTILVDPFTSVSYMTGASWFAGLERLNSYATTIMLENEGYEVKPPRAIIPVKNNDETTDWEEYNKQQLDAYMSLVRYLQETQGIPDWKVLNMADVRYNDHVAPGIMSREQPWKAGTYVSVANEILKNGNLEKEDYMNLLYAIGYKKPTKPDEPDEEERLIRAFRIHYSYLNEKRKYDITPELTDSVKRDLLALSLWLYNTHPQYGKRPEFFLNTLKSTPELSSILGEYIPGLS